MNDDLRGTLTLKIWKTIIIPITP